MPPHCRSRKGESQRFYARKALNTTLLAASERSMPAFWAGFPLPRRIHPALTIFYDEVCAILARLIAYVGALALLGILGLHAWDQLPQNEFLQPAARPDWTASRLAYPAFAASLDPHDKSRSYTILTHPDGGRKDIFRWPAQLEKPFTELEIYRPGSEAAPEATGDLAERMPAEAAEGLENAGLIDSKFGPVVLLRRAGSSEGPGACLGFLKRIDDPPLQLSGWSCQGSSLPARRATIGCMLDRLTLLASGNDPKLAELFARVERKRTGCTGAALPAPSVDWVTGVQNARLRGTL
jgi:hypothetical protein